MKKLIAVLAALGALLTASAASASTCANHPYTLTNGQTADSTQVMADFNNLLNCLNLNVMPIASPVFTGTLTGPNASLSGTLNVTGASTLAGNATFGSSAIFGNGVGGGAFEAAVVGGFPTYQLASGVGLDYGGGNIVLTNGSAQAWLDSSGTWHVSNLTVSGAVSLPSGSVTEAMRAGSVGGAPTYSCGDATHSCQISFNSKGGMTGLTNTGINIGSLIPSQGSNPGYVAIPVVGGNIYIEWGLYDCGSSQCWNNTNSVNVTLPASCPNGILAAQATGYNPGGIANPRYPTLVGFSGNNTLIFKGDGASDEGFEWAAICH